MGPWAKLAHKIRSAIGGGGARAALDAASAEGLVAAGDLVGAAQLYGQLGEREKVAGLQLLMADGAADPASRLQHLRLAAQFVDRELPIAVALRGKIARALLAEAASAPLAGPESRRDALLAAQLFFAAGEFGEEGRALSWAGEQEAAMRAFERAGDIDALENTPSLAARAHVADEYHALFAAGRRAAADSLLASAPRDETIATLRASHAARQLAPGRLRLVAGEKTLLLLHGTSARLGRRPDWEIALRDPNLSREHAAIERAATGAVTLRDLGSRAGTFLADLRVQQPISLPPTGKFRLGESTHFAFAIDGENIELVSVGAIDAGLRVIVRTSAIEVGPFRFALDGVRPLVTSSSPFLLNDKRVGQAELLRGDVIEQAGERWEIVG